MKMMTSLLMAMLLMVVGAALIEPVNTSVAAITTPTYASSVHSISALLPLFMVIIIILYVFRGFDSF
jgi:uncharacterized protein HemY